MDLLNSELELIELALEAALLQLQHKYSEGETGPQFEDLIKLTDRITKELKARTDMDNLQFEQLAKF